jgi:hypothetical protein
MDIVRIISKIKGQHVLVNESFTDNHLGWEINNNEDESSQILNGAYLLANKTENQWQFYHRPDVIRKDSDFIISVQYRVIEPGLLGNFGIVWGHERHPKRLNRFVFNSNHHYCAAMCFERQIEPEDMHTMFRASKTIPPLPGQKGNEFSLTIVKLGGFYYFFTGDSHSPALIEKENSFIMLDTYVGFYTEPGMKVEVTHFFSKKLITETVNEGTFSVLLDGIHERTKNQKENGELTALDNFVEELNKIFVRLLSTNIDPKTDRHILKSLRTLNKAIRKEGIEIIFSIEFYPLCERTGFKNIMRGHRYLSELNSEKKAAVRKQDLQSAAEIRVQIRTSLRDIDFFMKKLKYDLVFFEKTGEKEITLKKFTEPVLNELIEAMVLDPEEE